MSTSTSMPDVEIVDTVHALQMTANKLIDLPTDPPSIYVDLEGINLCRHGSISILSLYVAPTNTVCLIDIHTLGASAFSTTGQNDVSLKTILESANIAKAIFDVRNDSDALFSLYEISLDGVKDIQLMELASRHFSRERVNGLARCVDNDMVSSSFESRMEWQRIEDAGVRLFAPEKGGRYEVFNERPLKEAIIQYCAQDVQILPKLYEVYSAKLRGNGEAFWNMMIQTATADRIKDSKSTAYEPNSRSKVYGPWSAQTIERARSVWGDDTSDEAVHGEDW